MLFPKVRSDIRLNQVIEIHPVCLDADGEQRLTPLCPVRAVERYIKVTWAHGFSDHLLENFKKEHLAQAVKGWVYSAGV